MLLQIFALFSDITYAWFIPNPDAVIAKDKWNREQIEQIEVKYETVKLSSLTIANRYSTE